MYYPAFLNLKGRKVILFGAGEVALRKARVLKQAGADLIVISRDFSKPFLKFADRYQIEMKRGSVLPKLNHVSLVVAATSNQTFNRAVYEACERKGIFVNVVDDPKHSTFIVPSVLKRGSLQIAISTGGASPLLAKTLRKKLAVQFGSGYGQLVKRLAQDRKKSKRLIAFPNGRRNHFRKLVESRLKILEAKNSKKITTGF